MNSIFMALILQIPEVHTLMTPMSSGANLGLFHSFFKEGPESIIYMIPDRKGSIGREWCCSPGMTEMALKALSTLNVRRAEKFPRFTNSITYLRIFFLEREKKYSADHSN